MPNLNHGFSGGLSCAGNPSLNGTSFIRGSIFSVPRTPRHVFSCGWRSRTMTECLFPCNRDHVLFWDALDLTLHLEALRNYYNAHRVHCSLDANPQAQRAGASSPAPAALDRYGWRQYCHGLFQIPVTTYFADQSVMRRVGDSDRITRRSRNIVLLLSDFSGTTCRMSRCSTSLHAISRQGGRSTFPSRPVRHRLTARAVCCKWLRGRLTRG